MGEAKDEEALVADATQAGSVQVTVSVIVRVTTEVESAESTEVTVPDVTV